MSVQVAVIDPLPLFRDGAVAALTAAGHTVQTPSDAVAWVRRAHGAIVIFTVQSDADWTVLAQLGESASPANTLVVLLGEDSAAAGVRAVRTGARSVLARRAPAKVLERTIAATIDGQAVLPAAVAAALAAGVEAATGPARGISAEKLSWLRALASGSTVGQLADQVGYSERAMFRLLRSVYHDIGVRGRVEALMWAREHGWL